MFTNFLNTVLDNLSIWLHHNGPMILETLLRWINHYGPIILFIALALGIILLPVPEDTLMFIAGTLIRKGELRLLPAAIASILGAWCGITVSYYIGAYLGPYLMSTRAGQWLGVTGPKFEKAKAWFARFGKWSLVIGYFVPVLRHFTGYIAGCLALPYRQFSLFAYSGGVLWVTTFLTLGYCGTPYVDKLFSLLLKVIR